MDRRDSRDGEMKIAKDYWQLVRDKADELGTDGCTMATGAYKDCCLRHDVEYRLGTTISGKPLTREEADKRFLSCMQSRSRLGWWAPLAWARYFAVRKFGNKAWKGDE